MKTLKKNKKGKLYIISGPSGAGKTTIYKRIFQKYPNILFSISYTTRKPRSNEKNAKDYFFVSKAEFLKGIENKRWAEWAQVHENYYGTCNKFLKKALLEGKNVLCDIDVVGANQLLQKYQDAITIFIMPPSISELKKRLEKRGEEDKEKIEIRVKNALKEIEKKDQYKHIIINDDIDKAANELFYLIEKSE